MENRGCFSRYTHAVSSEFGNACSPATAITWEWRVLEGRSIALESVKHVPRRGYDGEGEGGLAHRPSIPRLAASTLSNSRPSAFYPCRYRGSTKARTEPRTFAIPERMLCLSSFSPCLFSPCVRVRACKWRGTQLPRVAPIKGGQENSRGIKIPSRGKRSPSESFSSPRFARFQRHSYGYGSRHPSIPIVSPQITRRRFLHSHIFYCPVFASLSLSGARVVRRGKKLYLNFERNDPRQPRHRVTDRVVYVYFRMRSWKKRLWQNIPKNITRPLFRVISPPASISRFKYKCTLTFYQAPAPDLYIRVNSRRIRSE